MHDSSPSRSPADSGFDVDDRVRVAVAAPEELVAAFTRFQELIESETLSSLLLGDGTGAANASDETIDGSSVKIGIEKEA